MTSSKLNLATVAILVLVLPMLLVSCGDADEEVDSAPQLTQSQIEAIVRAEVARAPEAPGLTQAEFERVVNAAIAGIPDPELVLPSQTWRSW